MNESSANRRKRLRLGPLLRVLLPSSVTLVLVVLLLFTMFFTDFDWQWVTFLGGILFASVLSLVSASWKSGWRSARRAAEAVHFRQRLGAEVEQHRRTREQLERELALHQQDRTRLAKEIEGQRLAAAGKLATEGLLGALSRHLEEIAVFVDCDQHCHFHTERFATWTGVPSARMDGLAFEEALPLTAAEALRPRLLDALHGRAGRAELPPTLHAGAPQPVVVDFLPQRDASGEISGTLVLIKDRQSAGDAAAPARTERIDPKLMIADEDGNTLYLQSLTEELTGWGNPCERIRQAIDDDGFDLYAQDIVALNQIAALRPMLELLIRMRDEEQNLVPPGTFLPIAERFGMMPDIDRFVVRKAIAACRAAGSSADAAFAPLLCINLARASIEDRSFPEFVARALEESRGLALRPAAQAAGVPVRPRRFRSRRHRLRPRQGLAFGFSQDRWQYHPADRARAGYARQGSRHPARVQRRGHTHHRRNGGIGREHREIARHRGRLRPGLRHRPAAALRRSTDRGQRATGIT